MILRRSFMASFRSISSAGDLGLGVGKPSVSGGSTGGDAANALNQIKPAREEEYSRQKNVAKQSYEEVLEQVKMMNDYFSQYVEEYYEEASDEADVTDEHDNLSKRELLALKDALRRELAERLRAERRHLPTIDAMHAQELVLLLREHRARDIVCFRMHRPADDEAERGFDGGERDDRAVWSPHRYVVICSPHNARHAYSLIGNVRKFVKNNYRFPTDALPRKTERMRTDWLTFDLRTTMLHMLTEGARRRYDLEALYALGNDAAAAERPPSIGAERMVGGGLDLELDEEMLPPAVQQQKHVP